MKRIDKSDVGSYTYDATRKHQVKSTSNGWSFSYDANGNMEAGRGASIAWTSFNYPASITSGADTSTFSYMPGRQYWKQVSNYTNGGAATTIYVGGLLEKVTAGGVTDFRHMISAGGAAIILSRKDNGTNSVSYVTSDSLGGSSAITNGSGAMLVNLSFDAFGRRRGASWSGSPSAGDWTAIAATTRHGYTDHSMLDNLGLIHMNGRVQDPLLGRFISADPLVPDPANPQSFNRYSYVRNNPLSMIDPSGFNEIPLCADTVQGCFNAPPPVLPCRGLFCSWFRPLDYANAVANSEGNKHPQIPGPQGNIAVTNGWCGVDGSQYPPRSTGIVSPVDPNAKPMWWDRNPLRRLVAHVIGEPAALLNGGRNPLSHNKLSGRELQDQKFMALVNVATMGLATEMSSMANVARATVRALEAPIEATRAGERFVRVGAAPANLKMGFNGPGGTQAGTHAFPESTFNQLSRDPAALKNFGDLPGAAPQYFRVLEPPAGTAIQRGIVPGGEYGGVGGVPEVYFPYGF